MPTCANADEYFLVFIQFYKNKNILT